MTLPTERYPIDFESLKRGDEISVDKMSEILGLDPESNDYRLALMAVRDSVVKYMEDKGDHGVIVTMRGGGLQILIDEDASPYVQSRTASARRTIFWAHYKAAHVDVAKLTPETRESHERWLRASAFRVLQMRKRLPPELSNDGGAGES